MSEVTYGPCLKELGPVDITRRLVSPRVAPPNECTYHEIHIYTEAEKSQTSCSKAELTMLTVASNQPLSSR